MVTDIHTTLEYVKDQWDEVYIITQAGPVYAAQWRWGGDELSAESPADLLRQIQSDYLKRITRRPR